jgi:hypothetical protein
MRKVKTVKDMVSEIISGLVERRTEAIEKWNKAAEFNLDTIKQHHDAVVSLNDQIEMLQAFLERVSK